jgi:stage II sporulation protein AA (anti-sigma F factor antagonist)
MPVEYSTHEREGVHIVTVKGRLDSANAGDLERGLESLFSVREERAVVNLAQLEYISSAGLRVMLMLAKRARQNAGRLVLCSLAPQVREVFEISGFLKILDTAPDQDGALAQMG